MAKSEMPGGRRRPADDRNTDKYYASGQASVVGGGSAADSPRKPGEAPAPRPKARKVDDKSTDKYYANLTPPAPTIQQTAQQRAMAVKNARRAAKAAPVAKTAVVRAPADINSALDLAVGDAAEKGKGLVTIAAGDSALLRRARTALEMRVTREEVSEETARDVAFAYEAAAAPPVPAETKPAATDDDLTDLMAFLAAPDETPAVATAAVVPTEVILDETGAVVGENGTGPDIGFDFDPGDDEPVRVGQADAIVIDEQAIEPGDVGSLDDILGAVPAGGGDEPAPAAETTAPKTPGRRSGRGAR